MKWFKILTSLLLIFPSFSYSENNLKVFSSQDKTSFNYEWINAYGVKSNINILIANKELKIKPIFNNIDYEYNKKVKILESTINKRVSKGIFEFRLNNDLSYVVHMPSNYENSIEYKTAVNNADIIIKENNDYLGKTFMLGSNRVLNYENLVNGSQSTTKYISNAFYNKHKKIGNERLLIDDMLGFYQSIPYSELSQSEFGFISTSEIMLKNKADCDSKSVSFLSSFKNIFPQRSSIIVLINGHAFAGIEIPPLKSDKTMTYKNKTYVLIEPVGPAMWPIGSIGKKSQVEIDNKRFRVVLI